MRHSKYALAVLAAGVAQAQPSEVVLHNFEFMPHGAVADAPLIRDEKGNFYGTTAGGGAANLGTVYVLNAAGQQKVLHSFTGGADGSGPVGGVIRDDRGNLYGMTQQDGAGDRGTIFKVEPGGAETVLYSFSGPGGATPVAGLARDSAGNLYGTTFYGGASYNGAVFELDTRGNETVLYSFTGGADGKYPSASVVIDGAGNLYGTTEEGGTANAGVVFKVDKGGNETVLYSFTGMSDGGTPYARVTLDGEGNLYGTTSSGGANKSGVVYKLEPGGTETVLYNIPSLPDNTGSLPSALTPDAAGNFYFTTYYGGASGYGVLYELAAAGNATVLHNFGAAGDGAYPNGVILDSGGNFYGATAGGGGPGCFGFSLEFVCAVVYQVDRAGRESVLYNFAGGAGGQGPYAGVVMDAAGNFYGTTVNGGAANAGVVFELDKAGHETVLYTFTGGADGASPFGGVIPDAAGNLYGTTTSGGAQGRGVVYALAMTGQMTILHTFTGGADGGLPYGALAMDADGNLYGTASNGGLYDCSKSNDAPIGCGVVYKIDPSGNQTVLYSFAGGSDGYKPEAGVILDENGNLYGTTRDGGTGGKGTVFEVTAAGREVVLHSFGSGLDGAGPSGSLTSDSAGNLYGTTNWGGTRGAGTVYKLTATGVETVLYSFTGDGEFGSGGNPQGGVVLDSAGNLYGTMLYSPATGIFGGKVYELNAAGTETTLWSFDTGAGGVSPYGNLILSPAGDLTGTAVSGGKMGGGVVFAIKTSAAAR
ncbi:MAG: choice-of-anchor tandem repeat GloVer-containing protein [Bryobacteraceae bacterium]|jgi:uncharacterized repeat protein (TIGR03803 family)